MIGQVLEDRVGGVSGLKSRLLSYVGLLGVAVLGCGGCNDGSSNAERGTVYPFMSSKIAFVSHRPNSLDYEICVISSRTLYNLTNNPARDKSPVWSPDGNKIAFTSYRDSGRYLPENSEIYVMNADGSNQTNLTNDPAHDSDDIFNSLPGLKSACITAWSPDGSKIAFHSHRDSNYEVYVMNADGSNQTRLTNNTASDAVASWSPLGDKIAFVSDRDGNAEIYVMDVDGGNQTRLTNDPDDDGNPIWSPDSSKIAFESNRDGNAEIYVMNTDGSNQTNLTNHPEYDGGPGPWSNNWWSPDGLKILLLSNRDGQYNDEIYVMDADGSNQVNLSNHAADDYAASWSPDGSRIVFNSERDSLSTTLIDIYVMDAAGSNPTRLTNTQFGDDIYPVWSPR